MNQVSVANIKTVKLNDLKKPIRYEAYIVKALSMAEDEAVLVGPTVATYTQTLWSNIKRMGHSEKLSVRSVSGNVYIVNKGSV